MLKQSVQFKTMMATALKNCPKNVLELKQKRSREQGKLRAGLNRLTKKLDRATNVEGLGHVDVNVGGAGEDVELLPYYLLQPKAKSGPPRYRPYLGEGEIIVIQETTGQGWHRGRLNKHSSKYKNDGYKWGYCVTPEDPDQEGDAEEHWAYLELGKDWGVLRRVDTLIDLTKVQLLIPGRTLVAHTVISTCTECNGGEIKLFKEEVEYLRDKLPFNCAHGRKIEDFQPESTTDGPILGTPRPGNPLVPPTGGGLDATRRLAAPSSMASTVDADRIAARCTKLERLFDRLVEVHADLRDAIQNCHLGEIIGYQELDLHTWRGQSCLGSTASQRDLWTSKEGFKSSSKECRGLLC